jgi:glyoxylase-like metal-dependent hydrolase (beta-lactamase superfamily II)
MKGYYRFPVGSFACTSLLDGTKEYSLKEIFSNAPEEAVLSVLKSKGIPPGRLTIPFTHLHIDTGDHQILVDTGAGKRFPASGLLLENMAAADIDPAEVDSVIITHAHPDHVGGMIFANHSLAYPNATYFICKREWDYWFSEETRGKKGEYSWFVDFARTNLEPIREQVRLVEFADEQIVIYPGVSLWRAPGHTPGHLVLGLESGGVGLLYIGDAVVTPIHLEHPGWLPVFDIEPESAAVSKRFIFDLAAERDFWVVGQHFSPFPSLGHVVRRAEGWEWRPVTISEQGR